MKYNKPHMVLILFMMFLTGCMMTEPPPRDTTFIRDFTPILILPPVLKDGRDFNLYRKLEKDLQLHVSRMTEGRAYSASEVYAGSELLKWDNVMLNGGFNTPELLAMARAAECWSVVAWEILEVVPYAPQRISLRGVWINSNSGDIIKQIHLEVNLANSKTRHEYAEFIGKRGAVHFGELLDKEEKFHEALLRPSIFRKFAAYKTARSIFE